MRRDYGNEVLVAIGAISVLVFALAFGVILLVAQPGGSLPATTAAVVLPSATPTGLVPSMTGNDASDEPPMVTGTSSQTVVTPRPPTDTPAPEDSSAAATVTATPQPTNTPRPPTATLTLTLRPPTDTAEPTNTPRPPTLVASVATNTPRPSPVPTDTRTPRPTVTAAPTNTPTPRPSATPVPTNTPTPRPTSTPMPTNTPTPRPSATPVPTLPMLTPVPTVVTTAATIAPTDAPVCAPPSGWVAYRVRLGDTLFSIARRVGSTVEMLRVANCLADADVIFGEQILYIPPPNGAVDVSGLAEGCEVAGSFISEPVLGAIVQGVIEVRGTANIDSFRFYRLEIRRDSDPVYQEIVRGGHPVVDGVLGRVNMSRFAEGVYVLRLVVVDQRGAFVQPCAVPILVSG